MSNTDDGTFGGRYPRLTGFVLFVFPALPLTVGGAFLARDARPAVLLGAVASGLLVGLLMLPGGGRSRWQSALFLLYVAAVLVAMGGRSTGVEPGTGAALLSAGTLAMLFAVLLMAGLSAPAQDDEPPPTP